jgi:twitching motility two-component system response regulator PilG
VSLTITLSKLREGAAAAKRGDKPLARKLLREAAGHEPNNEAAWLWLAGVTETPQEALTCLQRVLQINPRNEQAGKGLLTLRLQAGVAEAKAGNKSAARRHLLEVTKQDPANELAWLWLAGVVETPQEAVVGLRRVLEINPDNARARDGFIRMSLQAGITEAKAGNKGAARKFLLEVTEKDPRNELAWHWLAGITETSRDAVSYLQRVLEINPNNERAKKALDYHEKELASAAQGWQCPLCNTPAEEPLADCPECGALLVLDDVEAFATRVDVQVKVMADAIQHFQATLGQTGINRRVGFDANYHLGLAHLNLKQYDQAVAHFQTALRLQPGHHVLRSKLAGVVSLQEAAAEQARLTRARQQCILVVDDSPTVRKLVGITMEKNNYRVVGAADGIEATACLRKETPDLILLDITMPGMDGYQLCKLIKSNRETAHIPVEMLSGKDGFFDKIRGKMAGSTQYVTKPFKPEALLQVVKKHCLAKKK